MAATANQAGVNAEFPGLNMVGSGGTYSPPAGPAPKAPAPQQQQQQQSTDGSVTGTGAVSSTPAIPAGENANGGSTSFLSNLFNPALQTLTSAYSSLFGNGQPGQGIYGQAVGQAAGNIQSGYQGQQNALNASYEQAQNQMPWELVGRGAGNSSWADNNLGYANQQYNSSNQQLGAAEQKDLAGLEGQEQGIENQYGTEMSQYNNPQYQAALNQDPAYVQSEILNSLNQNVGNLAYTQGANTPISQSIAQLQQNPSYTQTGSGNISGALQALAGSGAPTAVQNQVASGILGNPTNPQGNNVWSNYWQQLQQNPNAQAPTG